MHMSDRSTCRLMLCALAVAYFHSYEGFHVGFSISAGHPVSVFSRSQLNPPSRTSRRQAEQDTVVVEEEEDSEIDFKEYYKELVKKMGMLMPTPTSVEYPPDYQSPLKLSFGLMMVPSGETLADEKEILLGHSDGADSTLTERGNSQVNSFAKEFAIHSQLIIERTPWYTCMSPLYSSAQTADIFLTWVRNRCKPLLPPQEDPGLLDIDYGTWSGMSVESLRANGDANATEFLEGSFTAKPTDGTGESKLQLMLRAAVWLEQMENEFAGKDVNVLAFGHSEFVHAIEVLLQRHPEKTPAQVFASPVIPGEPQILLPLHKPKQVISKGWFPAINNAEVKKFKKGGWTTRNFGVLGL